jgi:hypothetical protein
MSKYTAETKIKVLSISLKKNIQFTMLRDI